MLPGHVFGGTGSGDVKLLAAFGTLLGPHRVLWAFLYSAIAGGVLALAIAIVRGRLRTTLDGAARLMAAPAAGRRAIEQPARDNRIPFAPAIAAGTLLALLVW